ncbi:MAG: YidC/Oxa1 family insertase periplasmic-domain containing protein [Phycisphaerae bacterium]|nr:YidC/Oxa1 family insertase periplasmic-domain containing protein [Phycisphaerae bacterium]
MKVILTLVTVIFCLFSGLVYPAFGGDINSPAEEAPQLIAADDKVFFGVDNAPAAGVTLGSTDPNSGFKFELELTSKGAAISKSVFSEFDNREPDPNKLEKLVFLSPVKQPYGNEVLSMANREFVFVEHQQQLPLDKLNWQSFDVDTLPDGSQTARFETTIKDDGSGSPAIKLVKTYKIVPDSYLLVCELTIENLTSTEQKVRFNLTGPVGISREDDSRDDEKIVAGFMDSKGGVVTARLDAKKLSKAKSFDDQRLTRAGDDFLWAAAVNKYFAGILVPMPDEGTDFCNWVADKAGQFYNPDGQGDTGDETVGVDFRIASTVLASAGQAESARTYNFQLYLGPKDKPLFDKNEMYSRLGFLQTIDFMSCCCPAAVIQPLAFGILAIMKWMYGFIGNYGVVIIILVFLMRLAMHPVTKKSQVSMSKMSKLAPMAEEIKKKYAGNKAEMNKRLMGLYKEHGASPIMGMLPMFVQMPIWIALWSAVYTSIDLRGAEFLPFWITDLSVPDALIRFATVTVPLVGWKIDSFNLLPILMGVAFYMQQRLMPSQAQAASPEAAQQQKMMMIMMPLLFPLMLYKAPSGVNLYIMASTFAGVIEQYVIRKHIRERDEAEARGLVAVTSKTGGKVKKKKPKPFFRT